jgi:hypothetical protein
MTIAANTKAAGNYISQLAGPVIPSICRKLLGSTAHASLMCVLELRQNGMCIECAFWCTFFMCSFLVERKGGKLGRQII